MVIDMDEDTDADMRVYPSEENTLPGTVSFQNTIKSLVKDAISRSIPVLALFNRFCPMPGGNRKPLYPAIKRLFPEAIQQSDSFYPFKRNGEDGLSDPDVLKLLEQNNINKIIIAGCYTQLCIRETADSGLRKGYEVILSPDVVSARPYTLPSQNEEHEFTRAIRILNRHALLRVVCSPSRQSSLRDNKRNGSEPGDRSSGCSRHLTAIAPAGSTKY